jgi:uncharacterized LabA/DUF88 family protein
MKRVIAYIDGYNLYYGLKDKGWKWFYWLNVAALANHLLKPDQTLLFTKYFTSIVLQPVDRHDRQNTFLEALKTQDGIEITYGHFLSDVITCRNCGHTHITHHEKMTDVNIAVELLVDAYQDRYDLALLVTGDSDLVGPIKSIRRLFPEKSIIVAFPPKRVSEALKRTANGYTYIGPDSLSKSVFPDEIVKPDGFILKRPNRWY